MPCVSLASRPAVSLFADPTNYKTQGATFLIKFLYKLKHLGLETSKIQNSRNLDLSLPYPPPCVSPASRPAVSLSADPTNYKTQGATFLIKFLYKLKHLGLETSKNGNSRNLDFSLPYPL